METTITIFAFDRVVEKALEMLERDERYMGAGLQTRSLVVQEMGKIVEERDLPTKQGRLGNLLVMLQGPMDNPWNNPPGIVQYNKLSYEIENRLIGFDY